MKILLIGVCLKVICLKSNKIIDDEYEYINIVKIINKKIKKLFGEN
jgi:hypothetical protein